MRLNQTRISQHQRLFPAHLNLHFLLLLLLLLLNDMLGLPCYCVSVSTGAVLVHGALTANAHYACAPADCVAYSNATVMPFHVEILKPNTIM